jgi:transcriptional regulator with XRE-family HTH domain
MEDRPGGPPAWAARLRRERETRGWSQLEAVRALQARLRTDPVAAASLQRDWSGWENGLAEPDGIVKAALAKTFGTVSAALFPAPFPVARSDESSGIEPLRTLDLLARIRAPTLDQAALEALTLRVDDLCCRYARAPAEQLLTATRDWLSRLTDLLERRLTLGQHREVLRLMGYLALLTGCVQWDLGLSAAAAASRRLALSLGTESGSSDVSGWAFELQAWQALPSGDFRTVITADETGRAIAPKQAVAAQLSAQSAKAWARMGERREVEVALERSRRLLERLPCPENVGHHFVVDPARFDLWAMDCYRVLGEDRLAAGYAVEVLLHRGPESSPMRTAAAELTLGVVAARDRDLETAVHYGKLALNGGRVSLPPLLMTARELGFALDRDFSGAAETTAYLDDVRRLERKLLAPTMLP